MSVAVAHHTRTSSALALEEGARQAAYRDTDLVVVHVVESLDNDIAEANRAGISDAVQKALKAVDLTDLQWDVRDRKSTRLNSSHVEISYAVFCLKKKKK